MHNTNCKDATQDPIFKAQTSALKEVSNAINRGYRLDAIERLVNYCDASITAMVDDETKAKVLAQKAGELAERYQLPMPNCLRRFPTLVAVFQIPHDGERGGELKHPFSTSAEIPEFELDETSNQ